MRATRAAAAASPADREVHRSAAADEQRERNRPLELAHREPIADPAQRDEQSERHRDVAREHLDPQRAANPRARDTRRVFARPANKQAALNKPAHADDAAMPACAGRPAACCKSNNTNTMFNPMLNASAWIPILIGVRVSCLAK